MANSFLPYFSLFRLLSVTNAAGGLNEGYSVGDIMMLNDVSRLRPQCTRKKKSILLNQHRIIVLAHLIRFTSRNQPSPRPERG